MTDRRPQACPIDVVAFLDIDECPRCRYGPLGMRRKERRKRCPACFLILPWPVSMEAGR